MNSPLFNTFFMGGFECSTHRNRHERRLDMIQETGHNRFARQDYSRLSEYGMKTARDGIRWHLIETKPGRYDFSSVLPTLEAARDAGVQVIWDVCHYGWPDDLDIFSPAFVDRYARFSRAFVDFLANESDETPIVTPMNEISFFSWAGGSVAYFNPFETGRDHELKEQLVRAAIAGMEEMWSAQPRTRFVHTDPLINVLAPPDRPQDEEEAREYTNSQFEAWDMLCGREAPHLGGDMRYLDIMGVNYYPRNQWYLNSTMLSRGDPLYRPFRDLLAEVYERYNRPLFVAETAAEDEERAAWLQYVCDEVRAARGDGVPVDGITLYPIMNYPAWDSGHDMHNGLWDYPDENGERPLYLPLAEELRRQQQIFGEVGGEVQVGAESGQGPCLPSARF